MVVTPCRLGLTRRHCAATRVSDITRATRPSARRPTPLSFRAVAIPTRRGTSVGSPTTKGRWHGSSIRDRLHLRSRAGRARDHRKAGAVPRPAHEGRQGHNYERRAVGQAFPRVLHQEKGLGLLRGRAIRDRGSAAARVRARREARRKRVAVPGGRVRRPAREARGRARGHRRRCRRRDRGGRSMRRPAKTCPVCESGVRVLDYKDDRTLGRFLTERGKIRSEERRVGEEGRSRWWPYHLKKKKKNVADVFGGKKNGIESFISDVKLCSVCRELWEYVSEVL